jgi:Zn-finger nucleic acid-binding protein
LSACNSIGPRPLFNAPKYLDPVAPQVLLFLFGLVYDCVMKCPACKEEKFKEYTHQGVQIDFCQNCKGLWFDKAELSFFVSTGEDIPNLEEVLKFAKDTELDCARCDDVKLKEMPYHPSESLLIDYCSGCDGVLLDKKEIVYLEAIATKHKLTGVRQFFKHLKDDGYVTS